MKMGMKFCVFEVDGGFCTLFYEVKSSPFALDVSPRLSTISTVSADHLQICAKEIKLKTACLLPVLETP